ncbi:DUF222 domain-containing protein [Gordonia sp. SID5947]|uniref:DUF222 domain-containing protein n=1 Tax=Gordonia sp. SID5947 TaxID=2690315 RepID=UPI0031BB4BA5
MSGPSWSLSSWWRGNSPWPDVAPLFTGGVTAAEIIDADTNDLIGSLVSTQRGRSFLAWQDYQTAVELHARIVGAQPDPHALFLKDGFADCAARLAYALGIGQPAAEQLLNRALALRDRLPEVSARLRDGRITEQLVRTIISRTDLVDGRECAGAVDAGIAAALDSHSGAWSLHRLRTMVDRIVFRHDPDAVREQRRKALDARGMWTEPKNDGTAELSVIMAAENVRIAAVAVKQLAAAVCEEDGRTRQQRASDAVFALLTRTPFECQCGRDGCPAEIPEATTAIGPVDPKVVIHVVCDDSTLSGDAQRPAFMAGHGVISDEHLRALAARADTVVKPIVPKGTSENPDGSFTLPAHLPSDPYRPSTALETFVRVRDGFSVIPGNSTSAFDADLDHVVEFNHADPPTGGLTLPDNLNAKDRFGHLLKTFGHWVDEQHRDGWSGRLRTTFTTPEGLQIPGDAENLEALFPGLRRIRFTAPAQAPPAETLADGAFPSSDRPHPPTRSRSRVAAKHARRQQERERNRRRREADGEQPQPSA